MITVEVRVNVNEPEQKNDFGKVTRGERNVTVYQTTLRHDDPTVAVDQLEDALATIRRLTGAQP